MYKQVIVYFKNWTWSFIIISDNFSHEKKKLVHTLKGREVMEIYSLAGYVLIIWILHPLKSHGNQDHMAPMQQ